MTAEKYYESDRQEIERHIKHLKTGIKECSSNILTDFDRVKEAINEAKEKGTISKYDYVTQLEQFKNDFVNNCICKKR